MLRILLNMKILLFTDSLGAGGAQRQLVGLAGMLQEKGFEVKVCTYHNLDFYKSFLDENGIENELIPDADNSKKRILAVRSYFNKEKPDWVIAYQETPSLVACMCKLLGSRFRLLVSERNTTQKIGMNERVRFFLYRFADAIVPNSYSQEKFLLSHYSWMKAKLCTIINFVDLNKFSYSEKKRSIKPLIVVAATAWTSKNTLGLIETVRKLKERGLNFIIEWYGVVAGHEEYVAQCQSKIEEYGVGNYIHLLPKTKQIHEKYKSCDFFCLPSFYEGTPNVICEAMACGRPVLCSDVCDNSIYVTNGENGFLFDPHNADDMADKIEQAIGISENEYASMCKESRHKAEKLLSEDAFINKYVQLISSL